KIESRKSKTESQKSKLDFRFRGNDGQGNSRERCRSSFASFEFRASNFGFRASDFGFMGLLDYRESHRSGLVPVVSGGAIVGRETSTLGRQTALVFGGACVLSGQAPFAFLPGIAKGSEVLHQRAKNSRGVLEISLHCLGARVSVKG